MSLKEIAAFKIAEQLAGSIDKSYFLEELKKEWTAHLSKEDWDIEEEVHKAWTRIQKTKARNFFKKVGITVEDIRKVLEEIKLRPRSTNR